MSQSGEVITEGAYWCAYDGDFIVPIGTPYKSLHYIVAGEWFGMVVKQPDSAESPRFNARNNMGLDISTYDLPEAAGLVEGVAADLLRLRSELADSPPDIPALPEEES